MSIDAIEQRRTYLREQITSYIDSEVSNAATAYCNKCCNVESFLYALSYNLSKLKILTEEQRRTKSLQELFNCMKAINIMWKPDECHRQCDSLEYNDGAEASGDFHENGRAIRKEAHPPCLTCVLEGKMPDVSNPCSH
jgi:hypothetical protein